MKAILIPNFKKEQTEHCLNGLLDVLERLGIEAYLDRASRPYVRDGARVHFCEFIDAMGRMDLVIAIGGDGTIIHSTTSPYWGSTWGGWGSLPSWSRMSCTSFHAWYRAATRCEST